MPEIVILMKREVIPLGTRCAEVGSFARTESPRGLEKDDSFKASEALVAYKRPVLDDNHFKWGLALL